MVLFYGRAHLCSRFWGNRFRPRDAREVKVSGDFSLLFRLLAPQHATLEANTLPTVTAEVFDRSEGITTGFDPITFFTGVLAEAYFLTFGVCPLGLG